MLTVPWLPPPPQVSAGGAVSPLHYDAAGRAGPSGSSSSRHPPRARSTPTRRTTRSTGVAASTCTHRPRAPPRDFRASPRRPCPLRSRRRWRKATCSSCLPAGGTT
eukprot:scaffold1399_cov66-Phaeocystis_antarctica.AAC.2